MSTGLVLVTSPSSSPDCDEEWWALAELKERGFEEAVGELITNLEDDGEPGGPGEWVGQILVAGDVPVHAGQPVDLVVRFSYGEIYRDGFESGDVGLWDSFEATSFGFD